MFHGDSKKHELVSRHLLPSRRMTVDVNPRDIIRFGDWLDQQLQVLEDQCLDYQNPLAINRQKFGR